MVENMADAPAAMAAMVAARLACLRCGTPQPPLASAFPSTVLRLPQLREAQPRTLPGLM
jgi:hypothetical protein